MGLMGLWAYRVNCVPRGAGAFLLLVEQLEIEIDYMNYIMELRRLEMQTPSNRLCHLRWGTKTPLGLPPLGGSCRHENWVGLSTSAAD
jgi:hypothetical protein